MPERPTTDIRRIVLDAHDGVWTQFRGRLDGLTDDEYRWAPVEWHLTVDCFDGYRDRLFGVTGASASDTERHRTP